MTSPSEATKQVDPEVCLVASDIFKNYLDMPVWQLRHLEVSRFIEKHQITKVLDIGCAQGTLINRLSRSFELQAMIGIDFDQKVLQNAKHNVQPELLQESIGFSRKRPLTIKLYKLNILEELPLHSFEGVQLVTLIEFIEHIAESNLPILCDQVFSKIQPQYVIITTPNSEFNVHFNFKPGQMRHPDHLFQWNRNQFAEFSEQICQKYAYHCEMFGIGQHVSNENLGPCSQGAYFIKKNVSYESKSQNKQSVIREDNPFVEVRYPFWKDRLESKISNQLNSVIIKNNYSNPAQILEWFLQTKLGRKIMTEKEDLMSSGINLNFDANWVIEQSKSIKYCGYDPERNQIFYDYEDSNIEDQSEMMEEEPIDL